METEEYVKRIAWQRITLAHETMREADNADPSSNFYWAMRSRLNGMIEMFNLVWPNSEQDEDSIKLDLDRAFDAIGPLPRRKV